MTKRNVIRLGETRELILECIKCREPMYIQISNVMPSNEKAFSSITYPPNDVPINKSVDVEVKKYVEEFTELGNDLPRQNPIGIVWLLLGVLVVIGVVFIFLMQWMESGGNIP